MGYLTKLQVIQRGARNRLAAALELEKGETLEWVVKDRHTFEIRRAKTSTGSGRARHD